MFEVRVNGKTVYQEEAQVTGVRLQSARGELYRAGISTEGVVDVLLDTVKAGDPPRLDQIEAAQARARAEIVQGEQTGTPPLELDNSMNQRQFAQDSTLRPGGNSSELSQQGQVAPPSVDLAQGLDPRDSDTRTARLEAFAEHGDAQKAIDDNPPQDTARTAEQGAVPERLDRTSPSDETPPSEGDSEAAETETPAPPDTSSQGAFQLGAPSDSPPVESTPAGNSGATPQDSGTGVGLSEGATGGSGPEGPTVESEGAANNNAPAGPPDATGTSTPA